MANKLGQPKKDPKRVKVPANFRISQWLLDRMRADKRSQNEIIEGAIIRDNGWRAPE